jgi:predicted carbohydrate-binding protein with CBM5 and CBM33 domain
VTVLRRVGGALVALGVAGSALVTQAAPAGAHGAPSSPASRSQLCGESSAGAKSKACRAATAISGRKAIKDWDNIRLAGVAGRDRQRVPDGRLCSGGIARFKGLDLARTDWPTTRLTSGAPFTFKYRVTIPHPGTFKFYVTKQGYDPARRLRWSDLQPRPFLVSKNPPRNKGVYVIKGKLPRGKTGRNLIYVIWQTNPDTYYSCSDVVFSGGKNGAEGGAAGAAGAGAGTGGSAAPAPSAAPASSASNASGGALASLAVGGVAAVVLIAGLITMLVRRSAARRRRRASGYF